MVTVEIAIWPLRAPSMVAMGASSTGGFSTAMPGSARRKVLTQRASRKRRITCRNDRTTPMRPTATITPLRPGLAMKAVCTSRCSTNTTRPTSARNTSMRNRKIRGDETLKGSSSRAIGTHRIVAGSGRLTLPDPEMKRTLRQFHDAAPAALPDRPAQAPRRPSALALSRVRSRVRATRSKRSSISSGVMISGGQTARESPRLRMIRPSSCATMVA